MGIKCPNCHHENPDGTLYCGKCITPLKPLEDISPTKTLKAPAKGLTTGTTFASRYEVIEELGKGGMGRVFKVMDTQIIEEMALKLLKPEIAADEEMIERFRNELKIARKITHKNVCRMHDINEEEGTPYITMEYVEGEDLKSHIRREKKLPQKEAILIAKQVCEGLVEAHRLGVVHRDLKPQNIMIDKEGDTKIMDFGIARSVEAPGVTQSGVMIGTPDYMSPEQAEGEEADQRSDIYALGVILYEMVTGSVPFKGDTAFSVALKHKSKLPSDPKKLNPEVSENLSRLILICMEKERERRYQTAETLLADLCNIEEGFPLGTKIRPRRETFFATIIRKKLFIPALVVALTIIAVVTWQLLPQKEVGLTALSDKPSLAVVYFENNTGDEGLDHWRKGLSELLIADLSQSKYLRVLRGDRLFKILDELDQLEARSYSSDVLKEVASQGEVEHILQGSYAKAGDNFRINIMLHKASTEELIASEGVEGKGEASIFSMVDELTRKVKTSFDFSKEIEADIDRSVGIITTSSPEAYKFYIEGKRIFRKTDYRQSIAFLEKAIQIDPEFAMAYRKLAVAYSNIDYYSEGFKYLKKAMELSDRSSDRERYLIQGHYYGAQSEEEGKAIEAYTKLLELYPDDAIGNNNLGDLYLGLEEWDKAIKYFGVNFENRTTRSINSVSNLSEAYMAKGVYDKATEVLEFYIKNVIDLPRLHNSLARTYLCQGKLNKATIEIAKAISQNPDDFGFITRKGDIHLIKGEIEKAEREYKRLLEHKEQSAHLWAREKLGALYLYKGNFSESGEQIRKGIKIAEDLNQEWWISYLYLQLAYTTLTAGDLREALYNCDEAWKIAIDKEYSRLQSYPLRLKGLIYFAMHSMEETQEVANNLKELAESGLNRKKLRLYYNLEGLIELENKNFMKAIEYFKTSQSLIANQRTNRTYYEDHAMFYNFLALAYYKAGDIDKAREEYEKITRLTTGRLYYGDIYVKSFYMLGKIFEQKGWKGKAIEHYEKFLDLWKDADPGIAEVEDARKRVAGLK